MPLGHSFKPLPRCQPFSIWCWEVFGVCLQALGLGQKVLAWGRSHV